MIKFIPIIGYLIPIIIPYTKGVIVWFPLVTYLKYKLNQQ